MPLVRIDLDNKAPAERAGIIGDIVYEAMRAVAGVPEDDKFQVITRHEMGEIVYPGNGYLGIQYSPDLVIIQITWNAGRSVDVKKAFYRMVADGVADKVGISQQDVFINIIEVAKENWSFGNGEMQYAPTSTRNVLWVETCAAGLLPEFGTNRATAHALRYTKIVRFQRNLSFSAAVAMGSFDPKASGDSRPNYDLQRPGPERQLLREPAIRLTHIRRMAARQFSPFVHQPGDTVSDGSCRDLVDGQIAGDLKRIPATR